jgi:long-chain acyl-CoA synthetase
MKQTVISLLKNASETFNTKPYLSEKTDTGYRSLSFRDAYIESKWIASYFINSGIGAEDKVAILSEGRNLWVLSEFAIVMAGAVAVPLSIKQLSEEIVFRINHSDSKAIVVSQNTLPLLLPIVEQINCRKFTIFYLDNDYENVIKAQKTLFDNSGICFVSFDRVLSEGRTLYEATSATVENCIARIEESDVVSIAYTSGTTGNPKGIMLTHKNYYSNCTGAANHFHIPLFARLLVLLPVDHSFAHTVGLYISLVRGFSIYFVDSRGGSKNALKNIPINLKEVNPYFLLTVPALSRNFMNKILDGIKAKGPLVEKLFHAGLEASDKINTNGFIKVPFFSMIKERVVYAFAKKVVFDKVRKIFGNDLRFCIGGGAFLDINQQKFFYALGMPIYQGYGLTESAPIISTNSPAMHKLGSSGTVLPGVTCKILNADTFTSLPGEKGEIVVKGDNVMKGYYKNPVATSEVLKDGWLHTGDLGYIDSDNFLYVTGREKALLISADGEKYSPEEIEEAIVNCSELIDQAMVYNDHQKFTSAIITLNKPALKALIRRNGTSDAKAILKEIHQSLNAFKNNKEYSNRLPEKWLPSTFRIAIEPFSEQNYMVNSTLKMVRHKIIEAYKEVIDRMYCDEGTIINSPHNVNCIEEIIRKL